MLQLRKFLCGWFGFFALLFILTPIFAILIVFSSLSRHEFYQPIAGYIILVVFSLALAVPFGMAWWTVKWRRSFARFWAIIASLEIALMSLSSLAIMRLQSAYSHHSAHYQPHRFGVIDGFLLILGVAGVVAFARRDAMAQPITAPKPPRIAGDGTSRLLDTAAWVLAFAGYILGMTCWNQWGHAQNLPFTYGYWPWIEIAVSLLLATLLHECGHAATGLGLGMKLRAFIVGPFQWRIREGQWTFQFLPAKLFSVGGATALVPTNSEQNLSNDICMIAAGTTVNLFTGLLALVVALTAKGQPYEQFWKFFAYFSTISLIEFATNLIPLQTQVFYSDGAQIYQLLRGGPWADLHRAMSVASSTSVTPLRPRDYDIEAIQRAEQAFTNGRHALILRLLASSYFLDIGKLPEASKAVAEAERIYRESALDLPAELCMAFVFRTAFLCRDAAGAREWWERMEAKKPTHFGTDYWLAKSALRWVERQKEEAREAWQKGNLLAQKLPSAGDYEFDRYRCALLRHRIENEESLAAD
jgi:hypothetical protein